MEIEANEKVKPFSKRVTGRIVERLIPERWRDEQLGNLCDSWLDLPPWKFFLRLGDLVSFSILSDVRHILRTSRLFEPNVLGLAIAILGFLAGLYKSPDPTPPFNLGDFIGGMIAALVIVYWSRWPSARGAWISAFLAVLLALQSCLALLNLFPGALTYAHYGGLAIPIGVLSVIVSALQRLRLAWR
jgi:hypothetical protein